MDEWLKVRMSDETMWMSG